MPVLRKYDLFSIFNAISYVMETGCQWQMLPKDYPPFHAVYHPFRTWSAKGLLTGLLKILTAGKRASMGLAPIPDEAIIDPRSVRSALPQSQKGIDGHKRIKGIKRHVGVDEKGYVLDVTVSTANIHDSKGARPLIANIMTIFIMNIFPEIRFMKGDKAYEGPLQGVLATCSHIELECVKSNFGSSDFIPIAGRWVVERTVFHLKEMASNLWL